MKKYLINAGVALLLGALAGACTPSYAGTQIETRNSDGTITPMKGVDGAVSVTLDTNVEGENPTYHRMMVVTKNECVTLTADGLASFTGAGVLEGVYIDAVASAATVKIYDALTITGNPIFNVTALAVAAPYGQSMIGYPFTTGITVDVTLGAGSQVEVCVKQ